MVADIRQIFNNAGQKKEFEYNMSSSEFPENESYSFNGDIYVSGSFYNRADVVHMNYSVKFTLNIICDRCLKEVTKEFDYDFKRIVVKNVNNDNDEYIIAENDRVDVNEIALSDVILSLPTKMLCEDDCRGLCPICGGDLNISECNCQKSAF